MPSCTQCCDLCPAAADLVVSVTQPCYHVDYFIGILGMDLHLPDLVEDLTYFSQRGGRYAFIVDNHGLLATLAYSADSEQY